MRWMVCDCGTDGHPPRNDRDAVALICLARGYDASVIALRSEWLGDYFFRLSTRAPGEIIQKFATYGMRAAVVGDVSGYVAQSNELRDWRKRNRIEVWLFSAILP